MQSTTLGKKLIASLLAGAAGIALVTITIDDVSARFGGGRFGGGGFGGGGGRFDGGGFGGRFSDGGFMDRGGDAGFGRGGYGSIRNSSTFSDRDSAFKSSHPQYGGNAQQ